MIGPGKGHTEEIVLNTEEEEIIVTKVTCLILELGVDQDQEMTMEMEGMTDLLIDKVTEEKISDKIMVSKDIEQEVEVEIEIGLDNDLGTSPEVEIKVVETSIGIEDSNLGMFSRDRPESESRSRSSSHVSTNRDRLRCFRCSEYDHFVRECINMMTEDDSDQEDLDSAILQMLSQDDSLNYADTTTFLLINCKIGGTFKNIRNHGDGCLTEDQARYVYKKVNVVKEINTATIKQEIGQEKSIKAEIDDNCNIYQKAILNDVNKKEKV